MQFWAAGGRLGDQCRLPDYGANAGLPAPSLLPVPISVTDAPQGFVKFLGDNDRRVPLSFETIREIDSAGCHWAVAYPSSKRPRSVQDGAAIFIGRLTHDPVQGNDIRIFGRAIGLRHVPGRDDASPDEIAKRPWKADWPRYVRVHHAQFVAGIMANGVSMNELMDVLMAQSFAPTQRNARIGVGNTNPRKAYLRQAAVELSSEGFGWLADRLQAAFLEHGNVPQYALDALDRPTPLPLQSTPPGA